MFKEWRKYSKLQKEQQLRDDAYKIALLLINRITEDEIQEHFGSDYFSNLCKHIKNYVKRRN